MARIGRLDISWGGGKKEKEFLAAKKSTQPKEGKVETYYGPTSKSFTTYKNAAGDTTLTYDILEGIYRRTVMRRIIDKPAADATRLGFTINVTDENDEHIEKAEQICAQITKLIRRRTLKTVYRDRNLYGDAFLYIQKGKNPSGLIDIEQIYAVNPRYIDPNVDNSQKLVGWYYNSSGSGQVDISLEELCHIVRDPITGQLFGNSKLEAIMQVLNLILNSQLNTAVILDNIAIPMVHWLIDSKNDRKKTQLNEILTFIKNLKSQTVGNDIVTDASITSEIIGAGNKVIDFSPIIEKLEQTFYVTAAVPGQILGRSADNYSAITRQLQTYYEDIFDEQESVADYLIEGIYEPELLNQGIDNYVNIYATYSKPMIEQESRIATWLDTMLKDGIITKKDARTALGYSGAPPAEPEVSDGTNSTENQPDIDAKSGNPKPAIGTGG